MITSTCACSIKQRISTSLQKSTLRCFFPAHLVAPRIGARDNSSRWSISTLSLPSISQICLRSKTAFSVPLALFREFGEVWTVWLHVSCKAKAPATKCRGSNFPCCKFLSFPWGLERSGLSSPRTRKRESSAIKEDPSAKRWGSNSWKCYHVWDSCSSLEQSTPANVSHEYWTRVLPHCPEVFKRLSPSEKSHISPYALFLVTAFWLRKMTSDNSWDSRFLNGVMESCKLIAFVCAAGASENWPSQPAWTTCSSTKFALPHQMQFISLLKTLGWEECVPHPVQLTSWSVQSVARFKQVRQV